MDAASTERRAAVQPIGVALLIVLAYILWVGAQGMHGAIIESLQHPLELPAPAGVLQSIHHWLVAHGVMIGGGLFLLGMGAWLLRLALTGGVWTHLYVDADESATRSPAGYLLHALALLLQLALAYWVTRTAWRGPSATALVALNVLLAVNALWLTCLYFTTRGDERLTFAGLWVSAGLSGIAAIGLFIFEWFRSVNSVAGAGFTAANLAVAGCTLILLCGADAVAQRRGPDAQEQNKLDAVEVVTCLIIVAVIVLIGLLIIQAGG